MQACLARVRSHCVIIDGAREYHIVCIISLAKVQEHWHAASTVVMVHMSLYRGMHGMV